MTSDVNIYLSLVDEGLRRVESGTEADYRDAWMLYALPRHPDLLAMAVAGGIVADRLAWVFVSGYQAGCRHTFPSAELRSWVAYAATEDPNGELPGVTLSGSLPAGTLSGHKAWIAAARSVEQLVVKVGTEPEAQYLLVDCDRPGVSIEPFGQDFLSDLSQGRLILTNTPVSDADNVDGSDIGVLKLVEAMYVYAAFCGFVLAGTTDGDLVARSLACIEAVRAALADTRSGHLGSPNSAKADAAAQDLLARLQGNPLGAAGMWQKDQAIVAMYASDVEVDIPHGT